MLVRRAVLEGIWAGTITAQFRRWTRPTVKAGGTLTTQLGVLAIRSIEQVDPAALTAADAAAAGYADVASLLDDVRPDGTLYRIEVAPAGDDPRIALREDADLTDDARAELDARLDRLDRKGPWTIDTLRLIAAHPERRAVELADLVGRERADFKADVRKLKALGLTESLVVGYRLSPRGAAYLAGRDEPGPRGEAAAAPTLTRRGSDRPGSA